MVATHPNIPFLGGGDDHKVILRSLDIDADEWVSVDHSRSLLHY